MLFVGQIERNGKIATEQIHFNGLTFDFKINRILPIKAFEDVENSSMPRNANLLQQLDVLNRNGLLQSGTPCSGLVLYADDHFVNQESMKATFQQIGIQEKLRLFSNGRDVVDFMDKLLDDVE